ncbi:MAG: hypothetical protein HFF50_04905 [Lawsonibacter sp.]|nr:hypothetical protein [Lawsonibacter sp.]
MENASPFSPLFPLSAACTNLGLKILHPNPVQFCPQPPLKKRTGEVLFFTYTVYIPQKNREKAAIAPAHRKFQRPHGQEKALSLWSNCLVSKSGQVQDAKNQVQAVFCIDTSCINVVSSIQAEPSAAENSCGSRQSTCTHKFKEEYQR